MAFERQQLPYPILDYVNWSRYCVKWLKAQDVKPMFDHKTISFVLSDSGNHPMRAVGRYSLDELLHRAALFTWMRYREICFYLGILHLTFKPCVMLTELERAELIAHFGGDKNPIVTYYQSKSTRLAISADFRAFHSAEMPSVMPAVGNKIAIDIDIIDKSLDVPMGQDDLDQTEMRPPSPVLSDLSDLTDLSGHLFIKDHADMDVDPTPTCDTIDNTDDECNGICCLVDEDLYTSMELTLIQDAKRARCPTHLYESVDGSVWTIFRAPFSTTLPEEDQKFGKKELIFTKHSDTIQRTRTMEYIKHNQRNFTVGPLDFCGHAQSFYVGRKLSRVDRGHFQPELRQRKHENRKKQEKEKESGMGVPLTLRKSSRLGLGLMLQIGLVIATYLPLPEHSHTHPRNADDAPLRCAHRPHLPPPLRVAGCKQAPSRAAHVPLPVESASRRVHTHETQSVHDLQTEPKRARGIASKGCRPSREALMVRQMHSSGVGGAGVASGDGEERGVGVGGGGQQRRAGVASGGAEECRAGVASRGQRGLGGCGEHGGWRTEDGRQVWHGLSRAGARGGCAEQRTAEDVDREEEAGGVGSLSAVEEGCGERRSAGWVCRAEDSGGRGQSRGHGQRRRQRGLVVGRAEEERGVGVAEDGVGSLSAEWRSAGGWVWRGEDYRVGVPSVFVRLNVADTGPYKDTISTIEHDAEQRCLQKSRYRLHEAGDMGWEGIKGGHALGEHDLVKDAHGDVPMYTVQAPNTALPVQWESDRRTEGKRITDDSGPEGIEE
ncbi:hypothetical protein B0H10DRAFT_1937714 [Mycena sp. CBHHK59/15]|nr:hypothetical protein B0H10DRAFT_1937714 [Mycena sp. CBHHK59/15]